MTTLFEAVNASATTANGAVTNTSSLNKNVDLFFLAGASRGKDITTTFAAALVEDSEVAVRVLEWARDARGGAGERGRRTRRWLVRQHNNRASRGGRVAHEPRRKNHSQSHLFASGGRGHS